MPSVSRAAVVTNGRNGAVAEALERLRRVAEAAGVELLEDGADVAGVDIAIVLGGDGTMLRALTRFLGTGVPVIGVNYGRVGFLTAIPADELEEDFARVFAGDYRSVELSTLEVSLGDVTRVAVNDVVVAGGTLGRMVELGYAIGGEDLGTQPCDGLICASADRLDRLQPLERRPGARLGDRRDGADIRRAARAPHPAARRAPRPGGGGHQPDTRARGDSARRLHSRLARCPRGRARPCASAPTGACSRPCRR